jgi:hypothetical protein
MGRSRQGLCTCIGVLEELGVVEIVEQWPLKFVWSVTQEDALRQFGVAGSVDANYAN